MKNKNKLKRVRKREEKKCGEICPFLITFKCGCYNRVQQTILCNTRTSTVNCTKANNCNAIPKPIVLFYCDKFIDRLHELNLCNCFDI